MSIKINFKPTPFHTDVNINSFISLSQENYSGRNHIVLTWEEIKTIYHTFKDCNSTWATDSKVNK